MMDSWSEEVELYEASAIVPYELAVKRGTSDRPAAFFRTAGPSISVIETIPDAPITDGQFKINPSQLTKSKFQIKLRIQDADSEMKEIGVTGTSSDGDVVQSKNIEAQGSPSDNGIALIEVEVEDIKEGEVTLTLTATDVRCSLCVCCPGPSIRTCCFVSWF
jgi:hypothetical protein